MVARAKYSISAKTLTLLPQGKRRTPSRNGRGQGWAAPQSYFFVQCAMFQTSESHEVRLTPSSPFTWAPNPLRATSGMIA